MADDPTLRQRFPQTIEEENNEKENEQAEAPKPGLKKSNSEDLSKMIAEMNPKWKNWWIRGFFTLVLLAAFYGFIYFGPSGLVVLIVMITTKCYHEIISVGHQVYKKYNLPLFRTLSWYFLAATVYFIFGELLTDYFAQFFRNTGFLFLLRRHRLISFLLYTIGIMLFVWSLRKNYYKVQFALFGWYLLTMMIILIPFYFAVQNVLSGLMWFFLPVLMVICNDIFAYIFGFFFGRTRLIKLSPKKTWEGFIGGFFSTVIFGQAVCQIMTQYKYFHCPPQFTASSFTFVMDCKPSPTFQLAHQFDINPHIFAVFQILPAFIKDALLQFFSFAGFHLLNNTEVWMYPMVLHGFVLACFSSLIAPFGGFFASGFKRAFKIKDFADTIPGHGGIMDRFDCQYLMMTFVNVYIASVVRAYNPNKLLHQVMFMEKDHQVKFYHKLQEMLTEQGLIQ
eukprot:TCONS_00049231-protein